MQLLGAADRVVSDAVPAKADGAVCCCCLRVAMASLQGTHTASRNMLQLPCMCACMVDAWQTFAVPSCQETTRRLLCDCIIKVSAALL